MECPRAVRADTKTSPQGLAKRFMEGQILSTTGAGDHGVILGDDGARYTFTSQGWRDSSTVPIAGMRVDFEGRGAYAWSVHPLPGAAPTWRIDPAAPAAPVPPPPTAQARPVHPVGPPASAPSPPPAPSQNGGMRARRYDGPKKNKKAVGLLHLLGPLGAMIAKFYAGDWSSVRTWISTFLDLFLLVVLGFTVVLAMLHGGYFFASPLLVCLPYIATAIMILSLSEEEFDEWIWESKWIWQRHS